MKARSSDHATQKHDGEPAPLVWILHGHRMGDNLQLNALADGLDWPSVTKALSWRAPLPRWTPWYGRQESLAPLDTAARGRMTAPWPDIVLSVGWRSVPIARWIKAQCNARLVHIGRPRAPVAAFDLVLTTPQYRMPPAANVIQLDGPMTTLTRDAQNAASDKWMARLSHLPRPWTAVLVGGDSPTLRFPSHAARALATACNDEAEKTSGALLIVTSPRTSQAVTKILQEDIVAPSVFHVWQKDTDNPYAAFVSLADRFIVTNDSISMTQEAALTGKPVHIFRLSPKQKVKDRVLIRLDRAVRSGAGLMAGTYDNLIRQGWIYPPKSPADYFEKLLRQGNVNYLGDAGSASIINPIQQVNDQAVEAVRDLIARKQSARAEDTWNCK